MCYLLGTRTLIATSMCKLYPVHCLKSVRIRSFSGPYFPAFRLNILYLSVSVRMRENTNQKYSKYGHISRCDINVDYLQQFKVELKEKNSFF